MSEERKYLKYKNKYLSLKNKLNTQKGGVIPVDLGNIAFFVDDAGLTALEHEQRGEGLGGFENLMELRHIRNKAFYVSSKYINQIRLCGNSGDRREVTRSWVTGLDVTTKETKYANGTIIPEKLKDIIVNTTTDEEKGAQNEAVKNLSSTAARPYLMRVADLIKEKRGYETKHIVVVQMGMDRGLAFSNTILKMYNIEHDTNGKVSKLNEDNEFNTRGKYDPTDVTIYDTPAGNAALATKKAAVATGKFIEGVFTCNEERDQIKALKKQVEDLQAKLKTAGIQ